VSLRAAQAYPHAPPRTRWRVPNMIRAPCRAATQAIPPASLCLKRRRVKIRGVAWYTMGWRHTNGGEPGERGGPPSRMVGKTCQSWKANADARGISVADMGLCAACQQAVAVAALPVLTAAAGQQTLWHPIRDADRLAASRATAGLLPAWWDRCVAPAPARVCPCGSYQLRWDEDEAT
jgi:hypothetical protein